VVAGGVTEAGVKAWGAVAPLQLAPSLPAVGLKAVKSLLQQILADR